MRCWIVSVTDICMIFKIPEKTVAAVTTPINT